MKSKDSFHSCILRDLNHPTCHSVLTLNDSQSNDIITKNKLCFNSGSDKRKLMLQFSKSKHSWIIRRLRYSTLLHRNMTNTSALLNSPSQGYEHNPKAEEFRNREKIQNRVRYLTWMGKIKVILLTAVITFRSFHWNFIKARAILDSISMLNVFTANFANRLGVSQEIYNFQFRRKRNDSKFKNTCHSPKGYWSILATLVFLRVVTENHKLPSWCILKY